MGAGACGRCFHRSRCAHRRLPSLTAPSPAGPSLQALLRGSLRKAFSGFGLLMLGLGIVIGSGWAQLSGMAGQQYAGCAARAALTLGACRLIACRAACAQEGLAPLYCAVRAGS